MMLLLKLFIGSLAISKLIYAKSPEEFSDGIILYIFITSLTWAFAIIAHAASLIFTKLSTFTFKCYSVAAGATKFSLMFFAFNIIHLAFNFATSKHAAFLLTTFAVTAVLSFAFYKAEKFFMAKLDSMEESQRNPPQTMLQ